MENKTSYAIQHPHGKLKSYGNSNPYHRNPFSSNSKPYLRQNNNQNPKYLYQKQRRTFQDHFQQYQENNCHGYSQSHCNQSQKNCNQNQSYYQQTPQPVRSSEKRSFQDHCQQHQEDKIQKNNNQSHLNPYQIYYHDKQLQRYKSHHNERRSSKQHHRSPPLSIASQVNVISKEIETKTLDYLKTVIDVLHQSPDQFNIIANTFSILFDDMINNHYVMTNAIDTIFNESTNNSNFHDMGAKLYKILYMLNPSEDSLVRFLLKYKLSTHKNETLQLMKTQQEDKVRQTVFFLAELYMQITVDGLRLRLIAENIVFSLKQLLPHMDKTENVLCICLALKTAGNSLSTDFEDDMKEILAYLDYIDCQNPTKYPLIYTVLSMLKNNLSPRESADPKPKRFKYLGAVHNGYEYTF